MEIVLVASSLDHALANLTSYVLINNALINSITDVTLSSLVTVSDLDLDTTILYVT